MGESSGSGGRPRHSRRAFLRGAAAGAAAMAAPLLGRGALRERPNLVFFLSEGARSDESSLAGNKILKTPHIDRIGQFELYDLAADPAEMRNLYGDARYAALRRQLAARLEQLRRETGDHYAYKPTVLGPQDRGCDRP